MRSEIPIRAITKGPKFHWFSYYDKLQFDPTSRYVLGMEVDFEHRSPRADDEIAVGMIDIKNGDRWTELGKTRAWCWQQGCMLQWMPGSMNKVIWNDREGDRFVCHILNVETGDRRTLSNPIYTISPNGDIAITPDFRRINDMRPGYGYAGLPDPHADDLAPKDSGIFKVDLSTGEQELIISLADIAGIPNPHEDLTGAKHYFNHLLFNMDGTRFIFLHRWRSDRRRSFGTRMFTANTDGSGLHVVDDYGYMSHFIWRDEKHILAWSWQPSHKGAFYLYEDLTDHVEVVGKGIMTQNGHCSYLAGSKWILNDTYPDKERKQTVYLYNPSTNEKIELGRFYSPPEYAGEWRCDTHPRSNPDGTLITIDSPHGGDGRQIYLITLDRL